MCLLETERSYVLSKSLHNTNRNVSETKTPDENNCNLSSLK